MPLPGSTLSLRRKSLPSWSQLDWRGDLIFLTGRNLGSRQMATVIENNRARVCVHGHVEKKNYHHRLCISC